jgi:WD40 repeat protein
VLATDRGAIQIRSLARPADVAHALQPHREAIKELTVSPDGARVASASEDRTVAVFDAVRGVELFVLRGHASPIAAVAFDSASGRIATVGGDAIRVWSRDGALLGAVASPSDQVWSPRFAGDRLYTGHSDGTIRVWDLATGRPTELQTLRGHTNSVTSLEVDPRGGILASGGWDGAVMLWDLTRGLGVARLQGHTSGVFQVTYAGDALLSWSFDQSVKAWRIEDGGPSLTDEVDLVKRERTVQQRQ